MRKLEEASEKNEYTLFNLFAHIDSPSPYLVTLQVDGVPLQMEIDTGSSLSLISESTFWWKCFHLYLYGRNFTLATDHKPLLSLFRAKKPVPPQASGRIQQWALTLSMYNYTLIHKKSAEHGKADALSWLLLLESISSTPIPAETVLLLEQMNEMSVTAEHIKTWT